MPKRKFSIENKVARISKVIHVLLFLTNIIYAKFDSLRALKKEVDKDDQSEKGKAKTKEFSFPLMSQAAMYFLQKHGKVRLTIL